MICSLIGSPGVGKGTFAKIICSKLNWQHISIGDILREKLSHKSPESDALREIMNSGKLISDELANKLVANTIIEGRKSAKYSGVLLDGYPRTVGQAIEFDKTFAEEMHRFKVVDVKLKNSIAIDKLLGRRQCIVCNNSFNMADIITDGYDMPAILPDKNTCLMGEKCAPALVMRGDDTAETISARIEIHDLHSAPILDYYRRNGKLNTFHVFKGVKDADALINLIQE